MSKCIGWLSAVFVVGLAGFASVTLADAPKSRRGGWRTLTRY